MSLPGQQPGAVQPPAGGVPGAQAAVPGAVPGAATPGAVPGAQAGTASAQQPNRYSFFNRAPQDPAARFQGEGQSYRAKLIGIDPVPNSRGDKMCQEVILKQKSVVLASGLHKQRIIVNVSLNGIKLLDDDSKMVQFVHPVEKISFISRDTTDRRAFGYIVEGEKNKFHFFGIKTGNAAEGLVLALRDLFQVVYDIKQKEKNAGKQQENKQQMENLQQGIEALNVDIGGGETSDNLVTTPEVTTEVADVAAPAAAAAANGGDDLGFLDVQVSSAQEIQQEQSQQNKMANIMGAFGAAPAAAPMPGMGGQNAFGSAANNMGMQQPAMVNNVTNNVMGQMGSMPPMGGAPPMGASPAGGMMGGMGGMGGMAQPAQMGGMTSTPAMSTPTMSATPSAMSPMSPMGAPTPSSSGSNTANAMGGKSDPFASLGALTGIAPKSAPAPSLSMNQQQQQQQNNQFNQYMNNNVGAPASTSGNSMDALFG